MSLIIQYNYLSDPSAAPPPPVVKKTFLKKIITLAPTSITSSQSLKVLAVTALLITGGLLLANPGSLLAIAVAAAAIGLGALGVLDLSLGLAFNHESHLTNQISFEISSIGRLVMRNNYGEIIIPNRPTGRLFFGALPNQWRSEGETLVINHNINRVVAVTERWEGEHMGPSAAYNAQQWKEMGVTHSFHPVLDHSILLEKDMDKLADEIHTSLQKGLHVYVHCRAGVGRSSQAIAAYLLKYGKDADGALLSIQGVSDIILQARPKATILNKLEGLRAYEAFLRESPALSSTTQSAL